MANVKGQNEIINDGFLDNLAKDSGYVGIDKGELPLVERLLIEAALVFKQNAIAIINKPDRRGRTLTSTGALEDGITTTAPEKNGTAIEFAIGYNKSSPAAKYFDFVNEGVRGITDPSLASGSPYSFKASKGIRPSASMRRALEEWLKNNRQIITATKPAQFSKAKGQRNKSGAVSLQSKRQALTGAALNKSIAYAIGTNIRKKGIYRSLYFNNALDQTFNDTFFEALASVFGAELSIGIRRINLLSNE